MTVAFDGTPWLASGDLRSGTVTTLRRSAECPSLSPDRRHVAYKVLVSRHEWRLAVLDLATGRETRLPGDRSVDDQAEWIDDGTLLFGLPPLQARQGESDVWAQSIDGTSAARLLIRAAASPSVVR